MQINVSQQLKGTIGSVRTYDVDEVIDVEGWPYSVKGMVTLMRTDHGILVKGTLGTRGEVTCSRCLTGFTCPLKLNIEEEYLPTTDIVTGSTLSTPEDPGAFTIDERNILDLTEALRQYILLAIPMKPLCRQDCAGLCATCGTNLNLKKCDCPPPEGDPRWAELRKMLQKDSESTVNNHEGRK